MTRSPYEPTTGWVEILRQEALLALLDPERVGDEGKPAGSTMSDEEWSEFVQLHNQLTAATKKRTAPRPLP